MPNPATTADVENRWRPLDGQETTTAATLLDDAWVILKRRAASVSQDVEDLIAADADLEAACVAAMANAVIRVLRNPDGKISESIDDYSWSAPASESCLYIPDEELAALIPGSRTLGRAYSLDPFADRDWTDWS